MPIIGIDLGTTNSLVAVWRNGKSELIPNALGSFLTPSAVSVDQNGSILVGQAARERLISHPGHTAASFKRYMGSGQILTLGDMNFSPEELSALVLRRLREDAEAYLGQPVEEAVISVPAYFGEAQRAATKRAGFLAGLKVERLVNEPSAAALARRLTDLKEDRNYLIFDFGGGTLDVSVVECFENVVSVVAVSGDNQLGGDDFDREIAKTFCLDNGLDWDALSASTQATLLRQSEQCKIALNHQEMSAMVLMGDVSGNMTLTRQRLVELSAGLFVRMARPVRSVLADSGLTMEEIDQTILVGGSCHMAVVEQYLAGLVQRQGLRTIDPDTVVALGVGAYAGIKERLPDIKDMVLTDICPFTLGVEVVDYSDATRRLMAPIIERNSVLPSSKVRRFATAGDQQTHIDITVYQGEELYVEHNRRLGQVSIQVPPAPQGQERVDVRFTYDINGLLEVQVSSLSTETSERAVLIDQAGGMSPEEAERRLTALAALKVHPRQQEANRALTARGERLYRETLGLTRERVATAVQYFNSMLETQEIWRIERARRQISAYFDQLDGLLNATDDFFPDLEGFDGA